MAFPATWFSTAVGTWGLLHSTKLETDQIKIYHWFHNSQRVFLLFGDATVTCLLKREDYFN